MEAEFAGNTSRGRSLLSVFGHNRSDNSDVEIVNGSAPRDVNGLVKVKITGISCCP